MKRYLSILLAVAMLVPVASIPISASAAEVESQSVSAQYDNIDSTASSSVVIDTDALKELREKIHNHESNITITVEVGSLDQDFLTEYSETLLNKAFEHTGDPVEGDYVTYQITNWSYNCSAIGRKGVYKMTIDYTIPYFTTKEQEKELDKKVDKILKSLDLDGKTDFEKVCAVYDYLTSHVTYDDETAKKEINGNMSNQISHSAYGAICKGTAVCQGYANALYRLLLSVGVDSRIVSGKGLERDHAWNIARIDGKYYCLDSTWDSQRPKYEFFLCSESDFKEHSASAEFKTKQFLADYPISLESIKPVEEEPVSVIGDIDSDGIVTSADSLRILRISVGLEQVDENVRKLADVNGDGSVDSSDSLEILRYSVGLSSSDLIGTFLE